MTRTAIAIVVIAIAIPLAIGSALSRVAANLEAAGKCDRFLAAGDEALAFVNENKHASWEQLAFKSFQALANYERYRICKEVGK